MPCHLNWPHLPVLTHRLLVVRAAMGDMQDFTSNRANAAFSGAVEQALRTPADPDAVGPPETPRLEFYLQCSRDALEAGNPTGAAPAVAQPFRAALTTDLSARICTECSKEVCRGTLASPVTDVENLAQRGSCISPLKELFGEALRLARGSYGVGVVPKIVFSTAGVAARPVHSLELALFATTKESGTVGTRTLTREVLLSVYAPAFHYRDYFATLYVLFHELFSHAFCGISLHDDSDGEPFSEGWMDWVAMRTLVDELNSPQVSATIKPYAREMGRLASDVSARRYSSIGTGASIGDLYDTGRIACERLGNLMAGCLGSETEGWKAVQRFSVGFNSSAASDELRGDIVLACNALIQGWNPTEAFLQAPPPLISAVEEYLGGISNPLVFARQLSRIWKAYIQLNNE